MVLSSRVRTVWWKLKELLVRVEVPLRRIWGIGLGVHVVEDIVVKVLGGSCKDTRGRHWSGVIDS